MQQMCEYEDAQETNILEFCNQNIQDAIQMLHSGKAADELGLTAEHFKNSPSIDIKFLTICFNTILKDKQIPHIFKTGIVTPVLKKERTRHSQKSWVILLMNIHKPNRVIYDVSK